MANNINDVVHVLVTKTSSAITRTGLGTTMWQGQIAVGLQASRFQVYGSLQELTDAGIPVDHNAYKWATVHLNQTPRPGKFAFGRRVPGTPENDEVEITVAEEGTWSATVNSVSHDFVATATSSLADISKGLTLSINNGEQAVIATQQVSPDEVKFDVTNIVGGGSHTLVIVPPGGPGASTVSNTPESAPEDWSTAFAAINTAGNTSKFFFAAIEDRDDATLLLAAAAFSAAEKVATLQTSSSTAKAGTAANILLQLQALSYRRIQCFWKADDKDLSDAGMLGVAAAADLDSDNGQITWNNKSLVGVPVDDLSTQEKANIFDAGGSYYIEIGGDGHTHTQSVEGEYMRVQTTLDWTAIRLQEDMFRLLGGTPTKINLDAEGINSFKGIMKGRLLKGIAYGHYTADFEPEVAAPKPEDIDENDRNLGILRDVIGIAKLAQAVREVFAKVNLTV